jgi:hypothetical protein
MVPWIFLVLLLKNVMSDNVKKIFLKKDSSRGEQQGILKGIQCTDRKRKYS